MMYNDFSAAILAGGFSSRMHHNKAELVLGGITLLERQVHKCKSLGIDDIMLSGYHGHIPGTRNISDIYPHRGPLSGIHSCMKAAAHPHCLILCVDVPLVPEYALEELLSAHKAGITVLEHQGKIEPLLGVYDSCLSNVAEEMLLTGKAAVMRLISSVSSTRVQFSGDDRLLLNCNTPQDFEEIASFFQRS